MEDDQTVVRLRIGGQGRVTIPARLRKRLGLRTGEVLVARVEDGALVLMNPDLALQRIREILAESVPPGASLADELIAERREEARKEIEEDEAWLRQLPARRSS